MCDPELELQVFYKARDEGKEGDETEYSSKEFRVRKYSQLDVLLPVSCLKKKEAFSIRTTSAGSQTTCYLTLKETSTEMYTV